MPKKLSKKLTKTSCNQRSFNKFSNIKKRWLVNMLLQKMLRTPNECFLKILSLKMI